MSFREAVAVNDTAGYAGYGGLLGGVWDYLSYFAAGFCAGGLLDEGR